MLIYIRIDLTRTEKPHPCATSQQGGSDKPFREKKTTPSPFRHHHFSNESIRELFQQSFTSILDQNLGEQISQFDSLPLFGYLGHSGSHRLPALMLENTFVLLIQCQLRGQNILIYSFIVADYVGWSLYRDAKHPQLVPEVFDQFSQCIEISELT